MGIVHDAHIHFFSHQYFKLLGAGQERLQELGITAPPEDPQALAAEWISELDRNGAGRAALLASLPGDEASVEAALDAYPERFWGYFFVNPAAEGALGRTRTILERGKLRVPCLFPAMHSYPLNDPRVTAILDLLVEQFPRPVVFVHCGVLSVGIRRKLGLPSPFDLRFSNPIDLHPLALRYPRIRFVLPHFGAGYFREALMVADLCPNIYFDTSSSNSWRRYLEPEPTLAQVFSRAAQVLGTTRLLFGTDSSFFPRGWNRAVYEQQAQAIAEAGLSGEQQELVLGRNLETLLESIAG